MSQRYAQIRAGVVVNAILADPRFDPGDGSLLVRSDTAQIGDAYDGATGTFTSPAPVIVYQTSDLNFLQFMALFTPVEQAAIIGSADVQVKIFNLMAAGAPSIDLSNAQVVQGVNYLAAQNLVGSARVAAILAGRPPT